MSLWSQSVETVSCLTMTSDGERSIADYITNYSILTKSLTRYNNSSSYMCDRRGFCPRYSKQLMVTG